MVVVVDWLSVVIVIVVVGVVGFLWGVLKVLCGGRKELVKVVEMVG